MPTLLEPFFRHSSWATDGLLDVCEQLMDEQLDATLPGSYGTIRETLVHLVACEQRYIDRLGGEPAPDRVREGEAPDLALLKRAAETSGAELARLASNASAAWLAEGVTEYGLRFEGEAIVLLVQILSHSTEHRTQVMSMLSALGSGPSDLDQRLDGWAWGEATGRLRTGEA